MSDKTPTTPRAIPSPGWTVGPFWFEGNSAWGWVRTRGDWARIEKAYAAHTGTRHIDLMSARRGPDKKAGLTFGEPVMAPNYGFRSEHRGEETLLDHFCGGS